MSSSRPLYLAPNDAWIHADFTDDAFRPVLFQNAAARLAPAGLLILLIGRTSAVSFPDAVTSMFERLKNGTGISGDHQLVVFRKHAPAA